MEESTELGVLEARLLARPKSIRVSKHSDLRFSSRCFCSDSATCFLRTERRVNLIRALIDGCGSYVRYDC